MSSQVGAKPAGVKRVVFKQIVYGDFRKFLAKSNDADNGGGARDLRFRPHSEFANVFKALFPIATKVVRRRADKKVEVVVFEGDFWWSQAGSTHKARVTFEPPTTARPGESRITKVYEYPPFNDAVSKWPEKDWNEEKNGLESDGRLVLLLVQRDDGSVWPEFATETSLRSGVWSESVADPILKALAGKRRDTEVARGFIDFEANRVFSDDL